MTMNRREFLKTSSVSVASIAGVSSMLTSLQAQAKNNSGYKAMVCLFLYGGMDNHDTIIPYDEASYNRWAEIRKSILSNQQNSRTRDALLPISPLNAAQYEGRQFALPPEMSGLHQLFQNGKVAIIGNVGPLLELTVASQFESESVKLPSRLFSHNDQQSTWMSGATEGAQVGWAGQYADTVTATDKTFTSITTGGGELFLTGESTTPYQVSGGRALDLDIVSESEDPIANVLKSHFDANYFTGSSVLQQDMADKTNASFQANSKYNQAVSSISPIVTEFPQNYLGSQLKSVATSIAARDQLESDKQVFVVAMGGFDTHSAQANSLPALQKKMDDAIVAFYQATVELGLEDNVTLFTASDFGRTLATNGDGTDHGWGAHHFVIGGGVQGQRIFGDIPIADFGHQLDAGSGRLIPTLSVDQYAATLGEWFGVEEPELLKIFPNLNSFGQRPTIFG